MKKIFLALVLSFLVVGCGKNDAFVKSATVNTYTQNGEKWVDVQLGLNTWNLNLPTVTIPLNGNVGSITLSSQTGSSTLDITANADKLVNIPGSDGHFLPNGTLVPIQGAKNVVITKIPLSKGLNLYVSNNRMVGITVPILEFGNLPSFIPGLNYFPAFTYGNVKGVAGIYAGKENGLAFFVDISSVMATTTSILPRLDYVDVLPDQETETQMQDDIFQLGNDLNGQSLRIN